MEISTDIREALKERHYTPIEIIGKGGYAQTILAENSIYHQKFAIKVADLSAPKNSIRDCYINEVQILKTLYHPNIVYIYDYFETHNYLFIVLEYCENRSLAHYLKKNHGNISSSDKKSIMLQIAQALEYCHEKGIAHLDIKPSNIVVDNLGNPHLCDFGFSAFISNDTERYKYNKFAGSPCYQAPEIRNHQLYNPFSADMFSLGVTFFEIFYEENPFRKFTGAELDSVQKGDYIDAFPFQNKDFYRLVRKLCKYKPEYRLDIHQVLTSDYFTKNVKQKKMMTLNLPRKRGRLNSNEQSLKDIGANTNSYTNVSGRKILKMVNNTARLSHVYCGQSTTTATFSSC
ncbi:CAMK family protein kinase [Tritrichomonas foetus]|uniref:CAMK family protein kinase n=1 Tax=Tritrichomonas foetus TaxID=1144522 RepID=A0A1J4J7S4_9EUKA|nr:CAMK family protein kinase [Tritrichomonas foetus]|eukprot:OHS93707.1 CAMK family protein kinase [Tritrichomonas foetus]